MQSKKAARKRGQQNGTQNILRFRGRGMHTEGV